MNFNRTNVFTGDIAYWLNERAPSPTCMVCEPIIPNSRAIIETSAGTALIQIGAAAGWWCSFSHPVYLGIDPESGMDILAIFAPIEDQFLRKLCNGTFTDSQSALDLFANKPHPIDSTRNVIRKQKKE